MSLRPPEDFNFPFTPYHIQKDFMQTLYHVIENRNLGIFESPTGTGKSLSIVCGALRWLRDHNEHERNKLALEIEVLEDEKLELNTNTKDWIETQSSVIEVQHQINRLKLRDSELSNYDKKIEKIFKEKKKQHNKERKFVKKEDVVSESDINVEVVDDDELVVSEEGCEANESQNVEDEEVDDESKVYEPVKIFICSRTHSQLSQLIGEIKKTAFENVRVLTLASRQNYCINKEVQKLKNVTLINERCLDMQKKSKNTKTDSDGKVAKRQKNSQCPYNKQQNLEELRDVALTDVQDIEELTSQAKHLNACPYYASRKGIVDAEIVLVPYNNLLHKHTRAASGISLKNSVVIVDEAHNLLEAVAQMYSAEISLLQLEESKQRLTAYQKKFSTRFSASTLLSINQLIFILKKLITVLKKPNNSSSETTDLESKTYTVGNFVLNVEIDCFNMYKLTNFCQESKLSQKLHSYAKRYPTDLVKLESNSGASKKTGIQEFLKKIQSGVVAESSDTTTLVSNEETTIKLGGNPFQALISFLECLQYSYEDGRIIVYRDVDEKLNKLKFLLLNPAMQLSDVIKEARSVIFAGGTMKPTEEFKSRLQQAANISLDNIVEFSCDHIIPPENILPLIVTSGLQKENLLFNFENRFKMAASLKEILPTVTGKVPGGIVVFFPSYKYEEWVWKHLQDVKFDRPIFREPKNSTSVDTVLESYSSAIRKGNKRGAIMFSVVGGKLSEGLNFSDDLGRCVIVVGLPYANIKSPELKEKMSYLEIKESSASAQQFYEALCMKAVNQCIGRAVRHKNDYACVVLLDTRYERKTTKHSLPNWIKRSLKTCSEIKQASLIIEKFFKEKNECMFEK